MPDTPLYGGARADLGATAQPLQTPDTAAQAVQQANQRGAAMVGAAIDKFTAIRDFGEAQKVEASLRQSQAEFDTAMTRAMSLAPGNPGSLYDKDGQLDERALDDLIYDHTSKIGELKPRFFSSEMQLKSDAMRQRVSDDLRLRAMGHAATREIQMTKQALQSNLDLCLQSKDYDGFENSINHGVASGTMSWADGETAKLKMKHDRSVNQCEDLLYSDPGQLYDLLQNGSFNETLSLAEQDSMMRKLRANAEGNQRDSFLKDFLLTAPDASTAKAKRDTTPEFTGMFTERECGWINSIRAGRFGDVEKEIISAAVEEARSFNPADPGGKEREMVHADYIRKYTAFGMEEKFLERQWKLAEDANTKLQTPTIDTKSLLDNLESRGLLINQKDMDWSRSYTNGDDPWESGGWLRERYREQAGILPNDTASDAIDKFMKSEQKRYQSMIRSKLSEQFIAWREGTEEGRNATGFMQQEKFYSIARSLTGDAKLKYENTGYELDSSVEYARKAQRDKYKEWAKSRGFGQWVDTRNQEPKPQNFTIGFNRERTDLPEGILLPESMMEEADSENSVVEVTYDNKHFRRFRVVGTCEGDTPQMTAAVARKGFYNPNNSYNVSMKIRRGNADSMIQEQDSANGRPKKLEAYKQTFIDAGQKYGVEPELLMAIAMHETGNGTSSAFRNKRNAMGVSDAKGPRTFGSVEESIDYMARRLRKNYLDKGLTDIESIGAKYAPVGAGNDTRGLNGYWAKGVTANYNKLKDKA